MARGARVRERVSCERKKERASSGEQRPENTAHPESISLYAREKTTTDKTSEKEQRTNLPGMATLGPDKETLATNGSVAKTTDVDHNMYKGSKAVALAHGITHTIPSHWPSSSSRGTIYIFVQVSLLNP